jgi:23S rRNA (uracil1939-C5)-methyltransferase
MTKPRCKHFGICGGCALQNKSYEEQINQKMDFVRDTLKREAKVLPKQVKPVVGMAEPWFYRNKAQLPVHIQHGKYVMGYFRSESHIVCDMEECWIQHRAITMVALQLKKLLAENKISVYDEQTQQGALRHVIIRRGETSKEILLGFVSNIPKIPGLNKVIKEIRKKFPNLVSVVLNYNPTVGNVIMGDENFVLWGRDSIIDQLGKLKFSLGLSSFYQANSLQAEKAYDEVKKLAALSGREQVWDLYCGIGTISMWVCSSARFVLGIEEVEEAVQNAAWNAEMNKIPNVKFASGKVEELIDQLSEDKKRLPNVVIMNPPRSGVKLEVLEKIVNLGPKKIIYVSCNPVTLGRDLRTLIAGGYQVKTVQPYDFFPQTLHIENVVLIEKI